MTKRKTHKKRKTGFIVSLILIVVLVFLMFLWQGIGQNHTEASTVDMTALEASFCDRTVLVVLTRESSVDRQFTVQDFPEATLSDVYCITPGFQNGIRVSGNFRRILKLTLKNPCKQNVLHSINLIQLRKDVQSAEPNFYLEKDYDPISESGESYCNKINPLSADDLYWAQNKIGVPQARQITKGCHSIIVAVIDSGIRADHPSLNPLVIQDKGITFMHDGNPHHDHNGHGTSSAGLISSPNTGVAKNVGLVSIRMGVRLTIEDMITSIQHVVYHNIPIINMSMAFGFILLPAQLNTLYAAIGDWNGLFVAAAMNDNRNLDNCLIRYPARFILPNLITVGASDKSDHRWIDNVHAASNYSSTRVCVFAPGQCSSIRTTRFNGAYHNGSGRTSAAAPQVAGTAALMMSINPSLRYRPDVVRQIILDTAYRPNFNGVNPLQGLSVSNGRLDAYAAVRAARDLPNWYFVGEFFPAGGTYEWLDMPFHSCTAKFIFQLPCLTVYEILHEWDMLFLFIVCDCGRFVQYWIHFLGHALMGGSGSWGRNLEDYDMPIDYGWSSGCISNTYSSHHFWTLSFRLYLQK